MRLKAGLWRLLGRGVLVLITLTTVLAALNYKTIVGIYHGLTLFEPDKLVVNFRMVDQRFRANLVAAGENVSAFTYSLQQLPAHYHYAGETRGTSQFIEDTDTTGLIVTSGNEILYEAYFHGNTETSRTILWSVSKSVVSALMGIAVEEGFIGKISDPVTDYVPTLSASGYNGVPIKDLLQMSSGIRFNEDYFDKSSDFSKMASPSVGLGGPLEDVLLTLEREREPGSAHNYASSDTQVLGMVIRQATGMDLSTYAETRLWKPAGMEFDAYWLTDSSGVESAFGGFNATLRDLARFGNIYLHEGFWNGRQIVPQEWVNASITADADHLLPRENSLGYGYQWWIPGGGHGDFLAMGIYGQMIYVNPQHNIVIARTSAYKEYEQDGEAMELESIAFMRTLASALGKTSD